MNSRALLLSFTFLISSPLFASQMQSKRHTLTCGQRFVLALAAIAGVQAKAQECWKMTGECVKAHGWPESMRITNLHAKYEPAYINGVVDHINGDACKFANFKPAELHECISNCTTTSGKKTCTTVYKEDIVHLTKDDIEKID